MLDRKLILEFLQEKDLDLPNNLSLEKVNEIFCKYVEDGFFDWLNDNYQTFFNQDNPDWNWIEKIANRE
jgi:hypothetical protein